MRRITLVGTVHRERGLCNEDALLRILEEINPEVIFEETRPPVTSLETRTVARFSKNRPARQIPVDDFAVPENLPQIKNLFDCLFGYVESNSPEWCALSHDSDQKTDQLGFRYLNSADFEATSRRCRELFEATIALSGSDGLKAMLSTWNGLLRRREESMLKNIYDFCRTNTFVIGVFLVGAEHVSPIVEGIESRTKAEPNLVAWKLWSRAEKDSSMKA